MPPSLSGYKTPPTPKSLTASCRTSADHPSTSSSASRNAARRGGGASRGRGVGVSDLTVLGGRGFTPRRDECRPRCRGIKPLPPQNRSQRVVELQRIILRLLRRRAEMLLDAAAAPVEDAVLEYQI